MTSMIQVADATLSNFTAPASDDDGYEVTWVRTSVLRLYSNPYNGCWLDIDAPIRLDDVARCLAAGKEQLHPPSDWQPWVPQTKSMLQANREVHIQKIAWFVRNGFEQPIVVDVGVPSMGCHVDHMVQDGNHRFASAVFKLECMGSDTLIPLAICGSESYAQELGLCPIESQAIAYTGDFS